MLSQVFCRDSLVVAFTPLIKHVQGLRLPLLLSFIPSMVDFSRLWFPASMMCPTKVWRLLFSHQRVECTWWSTFFNHPSVSSSYSPWNLEHSSPKPHFKTVNLPFFLFHCYVHHSHPYIATGNMSLFTNLLLVCFVTSLSFQISINPDSVVLPNTNIYLLISPPLNSILELRKIKLSTISTWSSTNLNTSIFSADKILIVLRLK